MRFSSKTSLITITVLCIAASSCSTMTKVKDSTTNVARKSASSVGGTMIKVKNTTANAAKKSVASVTNIIPSSSRLPIAEVRPDQLQELKTGSERAVAYERKVEARRFAALKFLIPKSYNPPTLPEYSDIPEGGGLLPALTPN